MMKRLLRASLGLALSLLGAKPLYAQTVDGTFAPVEVLQSATINNVEQQPDDKILVAGTFTQINGSAVTGFGRLNADGTADQAFNTTAFSRSTITKIRRQSNGQIVLQGFGNLTIGGRTTNTLAKVDADGFPVANFTPGSGPVSSSANTISSVAALAVQADGKILVGGDFVGYSGVSTRGLVRLNANGSVDQAFVTALGAGFTRPDATTATVRGVVVQPDGRLLVCGNFLNYNGLGRSGLLRLNTDGTLDPTFNPDPSAVVPNTEVLAVALDPRTNNIVVASINSAKQLVRLTPTGQQDASFALATGLSCSSLGSSNSDELAVDASGRVIYSGCFGDYGGTGGNSYLTRFLASGQPDAQFATGRKLDGRVLCVRPLANGQLLVGGSFGRYGSLTNVNLLKLDDNAQVQSTFRPTLMQNGTVLAVGQQADGKLVVGGRFWQINGQAASNVARLNPDGALDPAFQLTGVNGQVRHVAISPDGRIVVGGEFTAAGTQLSSRVARLLANGSPDGSFSAPALDAVGSTSLNLVNAMAVQADGGVLVGGGRISVNGYSSSLHRLLPNGSIDAGYAAQASTGSIGTTVLSLASLPDNTHYVAGSAGTGQPSLVRLNANGSRDNSFAPGISTASTSLGVYSLLPLPNNQLLVGGSFTSYNGAARTRLVRLNNDGSVDNSYAVPTLSGSMITALTRYSNGRVLAGGNSIVVDGISRGSLVRFNPDGTYDASFANALSNSFGSFPSPGALLVQADDKILLSGSFLQIGGENRAPITRLVAPNVLSIGSRQSTARTEAWPVPAHTILHLSLDAAARPQSVQLIDNLGRVVLSQPVVAPELTLPVQQLRAGLYVLRVEYAEGAVTRRVVVE